MNKKHFYLILFTGIFLRIAQYFFNRSVWFDEAQLALNIIDKDFRGLLKPLENNQIAPVLFLFLEKLITLIAGVSELSLRFIPLIFGILCLPLIYFVTKELAKNKYAGLVALFLFSTSEVLIRYSTEVKQYECDVFAALLLFLILILW